MRHPLFTKPGLYLHHHHHHHPHHLHHHHPLPQHTCPQDMAITRNARSGNAINRHKIQGKGTNSGGSGVDQIKIQIKIETQIQIQTTIKYTVRPGTNSR